MLGHMLSPRSPYDVVLLVQLRNGSRVGEAVEVTVRFCEAGQDQVLVRVEKPGMATSALWSFPRS